MRRHSGVLLLSHVIATYAFWLIMLAAGPITGESFSLRDIWQARLLVLISPASVPAWFLFYHTVLFVLAYGTGWPRGGLVATSWLSYLVPLFAVYWMLTFKAHRARRRLGAGLCPSCGYDLRATPDRCPECAEPKQQDRRQTAYQPATQLLAGLVFLCAVEMLIWQHFTFRAQPAPKLRLRPSYLGAATATATTQATTQEGMR